MIWIIWGKVVDAEIRVRDSQEEANVKLNCSMFRKLLCPMSRHWKTLDCFVMLFNINCSQLAGWCIVKIAAGGKSLGSGRSWRGLVRTVFCPIC